MTKNEIKKITISLICHKEKESLSYLLQDLKDQTAYQYIGEVLLIQTGQCKETLEIAESFLDKLPLKIFSCSSNNLGLARATLVNKAQYEIIAFTDCDCRLPKSWLEELLAHWNHHYTDNLLAIGGPNRLSEKKFWQKIVNLSLSHPLGHGWSPQAWRVSKKTKTSHIPTTNGLFSKKKILEAGNFCEVYSKIGEDLDLGLRLSKYGELFLFPTPLVENDYANSYRDTLKRLFKFGLLRKKNKNLLFYPTLLFFPITLCFLLLSACKPIFLLPILFYFSLLFIFSLFVFIKSHQKKSFFLPIFWFLQHGAYSLGTNLGLFTNLSNKKEQTKT